MPDKLGWNTDPDVYNQVTEHMPSNKSLIRSQAPHYPNHDVVQSLNGLDIKFLKDRRVNCIVSLNKQPYDYPSKQLLAENKIDLVHRPIQDFFAPETDDFKAIVRAVEDHKTTLIHCGYGHGRTGTGVTAIQLYYSRGEFPTTEEVTSEEDAVNHIEKDVQKKALEALRKDIKSNRFRV